MSNPGEITLTCPECRCDWAEDPTLVWPSKCPQCQTKGLTVADARQAANRSQVSRVFEETERFDIMVNEVWLSERVLSKFISDGVTDWDSAKEAYFLWNARVRIKGPEGRLAVWLEVLETGGPLDIACV